ncbi:hypothetical protein BC826DRAFT_1117581 [Russula brevipes]|nr:hypothetical protein BC826DRAFT_1117581 [Russula brevipes]
MFQIQGLFLRLGQRRRDYRHSGCSEMGLSHLALFAFIGSVDSHRRPSPPKDPGLFLVDSASPRILYITHYPNGLHSGSGGNREPRARRPTEKQQQINEENVALTERRLVDTENRRRKEAGIARPRAVAVNAEHEHGSTCQDDWQIDPDLCELTGQGGDVSSQVDDGLAALAIANEDDSTPDVDSSGDKRARSPSLEIIGTYVRQAKKVKNRKGRSCANDFDASDEVLINQACIVYRCLISTENAFPSHMAEVEFAQRAWTDACQVLDVNVQPHPDALKIVMRRGSQMRGEVKAKIRSLVLSEYEFRTSQSSKSREYNLKRAAALKDDLNFTYKSLKFCQPDGLVAERKGLYQNVIIQKAVNIIWFAHRRDEGVEFPGYFHPFPLNAIALVLTAIECGIDEWISGSHEDIDFKSSDYAKIYQDNVNMLNVFKDKTEEFGIVPMMQKKLYRNGRFNSGAQPLSATQGHKLTAAAIQEAIQDWDDTTESEFSDGHDVEEE